MKINLITIGKTILIRIRNRGVCTELKFLKISQRISVQIFRPIRLSNGKSR